MTKVPRIQSLVLCYYYYYLTIFNFQLREEEMLEYCITLRMTQKWTGSSKIVSTGHML